MIHKFNQKGTPIYIGSTVECINVDGFDKRVLRNTRPKLHRKYKVLEIYEGFLDILDEESGYTLEGFLSKRFSAVTQELEKDFK